MNKQRHSLMAEAWRCAVPFLLILTTLCLLATPWPILAPLPAVALMALLWLRKKDLVSYLFYGIVFLIPFGAYRGLSGDFSMIRLHWLLAAALLLFVLARILWRRQLPEELHQRTFWTIIVFFYLINILAAMGSEFPAVSITFMLLLAIGYLLVALGMVVVDYRGFTRTLPAVIVGSVFINSVLALLGAAFNLPLFVSAETGRVVGGAPDPNNMSLMIIFSLPLAVYFLLTATKPLMRLFLLLLIALDVAAIMATYSRGGALILAITCLSMLWKFRHRIAPKNLGLLLGAAGLAATLLLLLTPESYSDRVKSLHDSNDRALRRRASYIVVARDFFLEKPLLGHGPDAFASLYEQTEIGRALKWSNESGRRKAHNTYIEVLTGSGLAGLVMFLLLLGYSMKSFSRARRLFLASGQEQQALLVTAYQLSFTTLLIYLLIYSEVTHKYLLVSLAASQIALYLAGKTPAEQELDHA
jgi:O-antigen ligase